MRFPWHKLVGGFYKHKHKHKHTLFLKKYWILHLVCTNHFPTIPDGQEHGDRRIVGLTPTSSETETDLIGYLFSSYPALYSSYSSYASLRDLVHRIHTMITRQ